MYSLYKKYFILASFSSLFLQLPTAPQPMNNQQLKVPKTHKSQKTQRLSIWGKNAGKGRMDKSSARVKDVSQKSRQNQNMSGRLGFKTRFAIKKQN